LIIPLNTLLVGINKGIVESEVVIAYQSEISIPQRFDSNYARKSSSASSSLHFGHISVLLSRLLIAGCPSKLLLHLGHTLISIF